MTDRFWHGKRVFVTGHTGFKGTWLCLLLQRLGAEVAGYALAPNSKPSLFDLTVQAGNMAASTIGDIRNLQTLAKAIDDFQPDVVMHLAAQALVLPSYEDPVATFSTNIMGTVNFLECLRAPSSPVKAAVIVTSDKCYENREWVWGYRESEPMGGNDPYSSSKACAELVTGAYRKSYFQNGPFVATARAGNVIGGGDWARDRLLADLSTCFAAGRPARIRNPFAIRPWQHVLDALNGYLTLARALVEHASKYTEAWNFGPGDSDVREVSWVADRAAALWGQGASWHGDPGAAPPEASILKLDSARARTRLDWLPQLPLESALEWTMTWYREFYRAPDSAAQLCSDQINAFLERVDNA